MKKFTLSLIAMIAAVFGMNAELYIVGNMNDWKFQQMTETSENVYTWTGDFNQGDDFKFPTIDGEWNLRYTCTGTSNELVNKNTSYAVEYREGGNDDKFVMAETGNYTVTVNLNDNTMICHLNEDVVVYPDLYIVGDGTPASWNPSPNEKAAKMKKEGRTYSKIIYLASDTRFVFLAEYGKYWPRFLSDTAGTSKFEGTEVGVEYGIRKYPIDENDTVNRDGAGFGLKHAGVYEVNVTLSEDGETGTMTLQYAPLTVVGPATEGWDLGKAPSMEIVDDGNYTYTGQVNAEEFRINAKGDWWPSFVMNNASDGNTPVAVTGGTYDLQWSAGEPPSMKFAAPGYYTLYLNVTGEQPTLTVYIAKLYIVGDATNGKGSTWNPMADFVQEMDATSNPGEFVYSAQCYPGQFKFLLNPTKWNPALGATEADQNVDNGSYTLATIGADDNKFMIPQQGNYTITAYTFGDDKHITVAKNNIPTGIESISAEGAVISVNGRTLQADSAVEVFDAMGRKIAATAGGSITLPAAGVYVAVSEGKAIKIAVK